MLTSIPRYVLDGNALGMGATEAFRRRRPVEPAQPDCVVVSIGYPLTDSVYSPQRAIDFQPPKTNGSGPPENPTSGADNFIEFIDQVLRPFIRSTIFPNVNFQRDALYGHSFGGLFALYALITRPELFDTYMSASPALFWENGYILDQVSRLESVPLNTTTAFTISYGSLEQFPIRRRTETEEAYQARKSIIETFKMTDNCNELFQRIKNSTKLRNVVLKEYEGQDHAGVGGSAITDGIDYFVDW
jgi:predicted alpha/beta superfamily hydrolase